MSASARWSYTAKATVWPLVSRDDWKGTATYGPPAVFLCDYSSESKRMTDAKGVEFTSRQVVYTEKADIKQGDMLLIGESALVSPVAAGAYEVRLVTRDADTFDRKADDFTVVT